MGNKFFKMTIFIFFSVQSSTY